MSRVSPRGLGPAHGFAALALLVVAGAQLVAAPEVRLDAGRVRIRVERPTPVGEVLEEFASATGAELVADPGTLKATVVVDIDAASEGEALFELFQGLGLAYALKFDRTGREVEMVVVSGASNGPRSAASSPAPAAPAEPLDEEPQPALEDMPPEQLKEVLEPLLEGQDQGGSEDQPTFQEVVPGAAFPGGRAAPVRPPVLPGVASYPRR